MSKKDKQPSFSFSNEKFMLGCFKDKYILNFSAWSSEESNTNMSSTYQLQTMRAIFEPFIFKTSHKISQTWTQLRPHSHTINLFNIKNDSLVATWSKLRKIFLGILGVFTFLLHKLSIQISMVSSCRILLNKESTSILAIYKLGLVYKFLQ